MSLEEIPIVGGVVRSGAEDRVFDTLLLVGPVLVASVAALGRTTLTTGLAAGYLAAFVGHAAYKAAVLRR